jgi:hypothetical protein
MSIVPPNFGSGAEVQATQDDARRRAEGVTPLLPKARKVVGATGFEPATPCAQVPRPAIIRDSLQHTSLQVVC